MRGKCRLVLASGRFFNDAWNAPIKELVKPDGIIHSNGSLVEAEGTVLKETYLDPKLQKEVLDFAYANDLCLGGQHEGKWYTTNPEKQAAGGRARSTCSSGKCTMPGSFMKSPCTRSIWMTLWKRPGWWNRPSRPCALP